MEALKNGLCHFDLESPNIIFDKTKDKPIIIDFGLSININTILEKRREYFYRYLPSVYLWPPETHYINLLLHVTYHPTYVDIEDLCQEYIENNHILNNLFSPTFLSKYKQLCIKSLSRYLNLHYLVN